MPIITPMGATPPPSSPSTGQTTARERAIAILTANGNAQESPVQNPSQVSAEEMSAVQKPTQKHILETSSPDSAAEDSAPVAEEPKAVKAEEEPLSSQYAVLARKEKALRAKAQQQEAAVKQREAAIAAREEAIKAKEAEYSSNYLSKSQITEDPWSVLQDLGISYDELTQRALNHTAPDPRTTSAFQKLQAEIKALKDAQESTKKGFEQQQQDSYKQAVNQIRNEARALVASNPDFETIKETNSVDDVVELIEQTFKADGVLMSVEEAAQEIENYLIEEAMKLAKLRKIQDRLKPVAPAETKQPDGSKQPQQLKTLTNAVGTSRQLSAKERAILAFKGEKF